MTENKFAEILKKTAFFITLFLFSSVLMLIKNGADNDLWHRMAVGKIFSQLGWITYNDIFSYFPKKEMWVDHEWLSGIIFHYLANFFGDYGLITLQILITFLVLFLIYKTSQLINPENKYRISYYLAVLVGIHAGFSSTLRCQCFTYLFFALWLYLLERIRRGETRLIWIFPATMLLWTNMHGGFLAGIGLVVFYIIGDFLNQKSVSKYFLILGLIIPVTLINPYGIKYWAYMLDAATMHRPYITEWKAFNPFKSFYKGLGFKILFLFLFAGYGYRIFCKFRGKTGNHIGINIDKVEIVALLITFYLAMKHERHSVFFAILAASYGYQHFTAFLNATFGRIENKISKIIHEDIREKLILAKEYGFYFFLILASCSVLSSVPIAVNVDDYPVQEVEFIRKNNISGNLFVPFNWGSYAMWKLYPQNLVSIDGRFEEVYKTESYLDVSKFTIVNEEHDRILKQYHHDIFLLEKETKSYEKLKSLSDWQLVYEGDKAAVFLPVSYKKIDWEMPEDDPDYYIKTKYENNITF